MEIMQFFWILNNNYKKISYIVIFIISIYEILIKLIYFFKHLTHSAGSHYGLVIHVNCLHPNDDDMIRYDDSVFLS